ncbi:MAG: hypothetical protein NTW14_05105 [bacterium]|nr:hypothetical protein [bacterium]
MEPVKNTTLLEIYNRQTYERKRVREVEPAEPPVERPPEDGKGQFVDVYV